MLIEYYSLASFVTTYMVRSRSTSLSPLLSMTNN